MRGGCAPCPRRYVPQIACALQAILQEPPPRSFTASVLPPEKNSFVTSSPPALSPDARKLAFAAIQDGKTLLWIRDLASLARVIFLRESRHREHQRQTFLGF